MSHNIIDEYLVRRIVDEPQDAFVRLYREQYRPLVAFFTRRVDDVELARDLTAEAFRIAWSRRDEGPFERAWLFAVARNLIGDEYRRRTRERDWLAAAPAAEPIARSTDEMAFEVQEVLADLEPGQREVLALTYWEGLDAGEVARVLGVSRSAIWMRLHRARRAFGDKWRATSDSPLSITERREPGR